MKRTLLCSVPFLALTASAVPTNHTLDDASPLVAYTPGTFPLLCTGCTVKGTLAFDTTQLFNGTVTSFALEPGDETDYLPRHIDLNFTGTGIYIFLAQSAIVSGDAIMNQKCTFILDGNFVGAFQQNVVSHSNGKADAQYNILAYKNVSIPDGAHTFRIQVGVQMFNFDYAIYTSNDPDHTSSPTDPKSSETPISSGVPKKKPSAGVIAGSTIAGLSALVAVVFGLFLCRRAQHRKAGTGAGAEESRSAPFLEAEELPPWTPVTTSPVGDPLSAESDEAIAERLRVLREQVRLLEQRAEGSSTAGTEAVSLGRSLSTMKREQMRVVQDHQAGYGGADSLVHTDSGLRLTAGREINEVPPSYVAD
ncbi:hypothetical protein DFH09DRAFT_1367035 [Mycena vulgaris]|nr:hypothetical protein DFH09DRAFT_1367035 [Mycena vulgaris]